MNEYRIFWNFRYKRSSSFCFSGHRLLHWMWHIRCSNTNPTLLFLTIVWMISLDAVFSIVIIVSEYIVLGQPNNEWLLLFKWCWPNWVQSRVQCLGHGLLSMRTVGADIGTANLLIRGPTELLKIALRAVCGRFSGWVKRNFTNCQLGCVQSELSDPLDLWSDTCKRIACLLSVRPCITKDESGSKSNVLYGTLGTKWPIWCNCTGTPVEGSAE